MSDYKNTQLIKSNVKGCHQEKNFPDDSYMFFNPLFELIVTGREDNSNTIYVKQNIKDLEEKYK